MDLFTLHQDIKSGFRQLRDLDPIDRRRYLAWRLALRQIRGTEQTQTTRQPAKAGRI